MEMVEGKKVAVEIKDEIVGEFRCPVCGINNRKSILTRHGQQVLKCHVCGQKLIKEKESGDWKIFNKIINERGGFKEASPGPVQDSKTVMVNEERFIERRLWQCQNCKSQNEVKFPDAPLDRLIIDGERISGLFMKCWRCGLTIERTSYQEKEETWEVLSEGRPVKR